MVQVFGMRRVVRPNQYRENFFLIKGFYTHSHPKMGQWGKCHGFSGPNQHTLICNRMSGWFLTVLLVIYYCVKNHSEMQRPNRTTTCLYITFLWIGNWGCDQFIGSANLSPAWLMLVKLVHASIVSFQTGTLVCQVYHDKVP